MADPEKTFMTLTGVYSGLRVNLAGCSGLIASASTMSAQTGYKIDSAETTEGKKHNVVTVTNELDVVDPPSIVISVDYAQDFPTAELDLDVKFTDIPTGTSLQVASTATTFNISKQLINGSGLVGSSGKKVEAFETSLTISLWIAQPKSISTNSGLTLCMSKIVGGSGAPVKKVLLEQIVVNFLI